MPTQTKMPNAKTTVIPEHGADLSRSAALYERALKVLPGGVSRNAILRASHPTYVECGKGCRVTDLEGVTRIDFSNNMASLIHGHACPEVIHAVTEQMTRGTAFMMGTEIEVRYAEHLCSRNRSFEKMRFMNSGTEAIMVALKAARAFTGRPKIAKAEGAYHGVYDYAEVSQGSTPATWGGIDHPRSVPLVHGTPESALKDVVVFPFNDTERTLAILDEHAGLQARYDVTPDMTALGKIIGGGFPIGAVAGRAEVMDVLNPQSPRYVFPHSGTFTANPISMTAGMAAML